MLNNPSARPTFPNSGRRPSTEVKPTPDHVTRRQQAQHARIAAKMAQKQKLALADKILTHRKKGIMEVKAMRVQERRIALTLPRLISKHVKVPKNPAFQPVVKTQPEIEMIAVETPMTGMPSDWQNPELPHAGTFAALAKFQSISL